MVSGGALTGGSGGGVMGGGDSSESHDTDDIPDDTDSPPALRRRVADKLRPQSELINQILIDKFKVNFSLSSLIVACRIFVAEKRFSTRQTPLVRPIQQRLATEKQLLRIAVNIKSV